MQKKSICYFGLNLQQVALVFCLILLGGIFPERTLCSDMFNSRELALEIAKHLGQIPGRKYATVAFSRIQGDLDRSKADELIDYTENAIIKSRRFKVIDRSKLPLILRTQKYNLNEMVSSDTYKQQGNILGIDLFIYGRYYGDTIVLKAIDVESSAIIWANIFKLKELSNETIIIKNLAVVVNASIKKDIGILRSSRIKNISFKSIQSDFDSRKVIDFLSVAITREGSLSVIDWGNLRARLSELKLSMEDFIEKRKEDRMGRLKSVDALILGKVTLKRGNYEASLKMLNIDSGAYEWADTFKVESRRKITKQFGKKRIRETNTEMVYIPSGEFVMGSNKGGISTSPAFRVAIRSFYIDRIEVSNRKYQEFVRIYKHRAPPSWPGGKIPKGDENRPVVTVNWNDANKYCSKQISNNRSKRLPTESEWEKAYRGTEGRKYPWKSDKWFPENTITAESGAVKTGGVDSNTQDISYYGVKFMAGNVREWVSSYLRPYPGSRFYTPGVGREKVIRGGSWNTTARQAAGWFRNSGKPVNGWKDVGFRCAKSK